MTRAGRLVDVGRPSSVISKGVKDLNWVNPQTHDRGTIGEKWKLFCQRILKIAYLSLFTGEDRPNRLA